MRILLCKGQFLGPISGADETLVTYATELQKAGHSVGVFLLYLLSQDDPHYRRLLEADVPVAWIASDIARTTVGTGRKMFNHLLRTVPASRRFARRRVQQIMTGMASRYYEQCRSYFEKSGADLIHVFTPDPGAKVIIEAGHDAGIPVLYQELGTPYHPPDFESYYEQFTSAIPLCSEIAALSPLLAQICRQRLPTSNQLSVLPVMSDESGNGHSASRAANSDVTFGFAARIERMKGPMILMEAFASAHSRFPNIVLKVAGEGSQRQAMASLAKRSRVASRYHAVGVYTRPLERARFMGSLDVFVMPSFTEGTPNSIIEAMAHGKPIIASAVGGIPDMIDEASGILVNPGDANALCDAMLRLARDPELRRRMGKAARARFEALFSPQAVLPGILETYRRLASRNGGNHHAAANGNSHPWSSRLVDS